MSRYSLDSVIDTIRVMGSNEKVHIDEYLDRVILVINKDPDYDHNKNVVIMDMLGEDVMNFVSVDFQLDGRTIASTYNIHVDRLEQALNEIRDGNTSYLATSDKPLRQLVDEAKSPRKQRVVNSIER